MIDQAAFAEFGIAVVAAADVEQRVPYPRCAKGDDDDALGINIETGVASGGVKIVMDLSVGRRASRNGDHSRIRRHVALLAEMGTARR